MARVKLVGGCADGSVAFVADSQDSIFVPRSWARRGHKGQVSREELRDANDQEKYTRSDRFDEDGDAIFVAESSPGLLG